MDVMAERRECIRCGTCCLKSSPTLQKEDAGLVLEGWLPMGGLYTIRVGELVHDPLEGQAGIAAREMIKVKERPRGGGCVFYEDAQKACLVYDHRPRQCAALACWDQSEFMRVYEGAKAQRTDVIEAKVLLDLMAEHEERCSYQELAHWIWGIEKQGEKAVQEIIKLLRFDYELRRLVALKLDLEEAWMDLFFGRPLTETIGVFGLQVIRQEDGTFLLTTKNAGGAERP